MLVDHGWNSANDYCQQKNAKQHHNSKVIQQDYQLEHYVTRRRLHPK